MNIAFPVLARSPGGTPAQTFLVNQNFETPTTGYDNGETWTPNGTVDPAYTGSILRGTQSCRCSGSGVISWTYTTYANQTLDVWAFSDFKVRVFPANSDAAIRICDSSNTILAGLQITTPDSVHVNFQLLSNGAASSVSAYSPANVTQYCWLHWAPGGTCELFISGSTTRPAASDSASSTYLTGTGASGTASRVFLYNQFTGDLVFDHVLVSATSIGDNP